MSEVYDRLMINQNQFMILNCFHFMFRYNVEQYQNVLRFKNETLLNLISIIKIKRKNCKDF